MAGHRRASSRRAGTRKRRLQFETLESRQLLAVVINEIHYNPADNTKLEEFIELYNTGSTAVDLSGWAFTDGVDFTFAPGQQIAAGGYVVVAQDPATMLAEFGVAAVGAYSGGLNSDGEKIVSQQANFFPLFPPEGIVVPPTEIITAVGLMLLGLAVVLLLEWIANREEARHKRQNAPAS